jgi:hypothetical protein
MSVVIVPGVAGLDASTERMIASSTSSTAITATGGVTAFEHTIPARAVGSDGYIVLDIYMTRSGPNGAIVPLLLLGGQPFHSDAMAITDLSFQTRFYIYADDSETAQKLATDMGVVDTPYAKGNYTKVNLTVDMTLDTTLSLYVNIGSSGDGLVVEGYSIRLFNPDGV